MRAIVRRATAGDAATVMAVYLEAWRAGYQGLLADDVLEAQARTRAWYYWLGAMTRTDTTVAVAEDERIVGVVECEHAPSAGTPALGAHALRGALGLGGPGRPRRC